MSDTNIIEQFNNELTNLFNNVMKYGFLVRKHKLDGKKYWTNAENVISPNNISMNKWSVQSYSFYYDLINMGVIEDPTMITTHDEWQYNHFLLQHGRLIKKECALNRLLQIAYNGGQMAYCLKNSEGTYVYTYERIKYYVSNSMTRWSTYIEPNDLKSVSTNSNMTKLINLNQWFNKQISELDN
jgi:hypothetical protein